MKKIYVTTFIKNKGLTYKAGEIYMVDDAIATELTSKYTADEDGNKSYYAFEV